MGISVMNNDCFFVLFRVKFNPLNFFVIFLKFRLPNAAVYYIIVNTGSHTRNRTTLKS